MKFRVKGDTEYSVKPDQIFIKDEEQRLVEAWASVEVKDKQGEIIPIEELEKIMPIVMDRGGLVMYRHSNKPVGKILNWKIEEHPETKAKGLKLLIKVFNHYKLDNMVWDMIKNGKIKGISFGGASEKQSYMPWEKGKDIVRVLRDIEGYEFSLVENPANPYATIESINWFAKEDSGETKCPLSILDEVLQKAERLFKEGKMEKEEYERIVKEAEEVIQEMKKITEPTEEEIESVRRKIESGKSPDELTDREIWIWRNYIKEKEMAEVQKPFAGFENFDDCLKKMKEKGYSEESAKRICGKLYWQYHKAEDFIKELEEMSEEERKELLNTIKKEYEEVLKPQDLRPPKEWWEHCIRRVRGIADDPEALCGWIFYHHLKPTKPKGDIVDIKNSARDSRNYWICPICGESFNENELSYFYRHLRFEEGLSEEEANEIIEELEKGGIEKKETEKNTVKKKTRPDKPYTREARARKRSWLRTRGRRKGDNDRASELLLGDVEKQADRLYRIAQKVIALYDYELQRGMRWDKLIDLLKRKFHISEADAMEVASIIESYGYVLKGLEKQDEPEDWDELHVRDVGRLIATFDNREEAEEYAKDKPNCKVIMTQRGRWAVVDVGEKKESKKESEPPVAWMNKVIEKLDERGISNSSEVAEWIFKNLLNEDRIKAMRSLRKNLDELIDVAVDVFETLKELE